MQAKTLILLCFPSAGNALFLPRCSNTRVDIELIPV